MKFPSWVPVSARQTIEDFAAGDLSPELRAVLLRFATDDAMRDVWKKQPPDKMRVVIALALLAYAHGATTPGFGPPHG